MKPQRRATRTTNPKIKSNKSDRRVEPAVSNADPVFSGILDRKEKGCFALKRGFFCHWFENKRKQTSKKMLRVTCDWWLRTRGGGGQSRVRVRVLAWPWHSLRQNSFISGSWFPTNHTLLSGTFSCRPNNGVPYPRARRSCGCVLRDTRHETKNKR